MNIHIAGLTSLSGTSRNMISSITTEHKKKPKQNTHIQPEAKVAHIMNIIAPHLNHLTDDEFINLQQKMKTMIIKEGL